VEQYTVLVVFCVKDFSLGLDERSCNNRKP